MLKGYRYIGTFISDSNPFEEPNIEFYDIRYLVKNKSELKLLMQMLDI